MKCGQNKVKNKELLELGFVLAFFYKKTLTTFEISAKHRYQRM